MAHTHDLIEAKISTRTRKERQRKKKNCKMVSFRNLLLCVSFLGVPVSSEVMSYSSHVAHEYKAILDSFFFLNIFAFRAYITCKVILARSHTPYLRCQSGVHNWRILSFLLLKLKSHTNKKSK